MFWRDTRKDLEASQKCLQIYMKACRDLQSNIQDMNAKLRNVRDVMAELSTLASKLKKTADASDNIDLQLKLRVEAEYHLFARKLIGMAIGAD